MGRRVRIFFCFFSFFSFCQNNEKNEVFIQGLFLFLSLCVFFLSLSLLEPLLSWKA
jgi:hypothetical protein